MGENMKLKFPDKETFERIAKGEIILYQKRGKKRVRMRVKRKGDILIVGEYD